VAPGVAEALFAIDDLRCGACVANVERALGRAPGVLHARANLTAKRVAVRWQEGESGSGEIEDVLERAGFPARPIRAGAAEGEDRTGGRCSSRSASRASRPPTS
jgi:copper chaperone CopZ